MRVITPDCLVKLKNSILKFVQLLNLESDDSNIMYLLKSFNLDNDKFADMYTKEPIKQKQ